MIAISCQHFVEIPTPPTRIVSDDVFKSDATATASINGLYSQIMNTSSTALNGGISIYAAFSADELSRTSPTAAENAFLNNGLLPDNSLLGQLWPNLYNLIYHANSIIEGLNKSTGVTDGVKKQLLGEAKFVRAFCYFNLVNLYGDVPLLLTTDYRVNAIEPRKETGKVYDQIVADLLEAQSLVAAGYVSTDRSRPNQFAVTALLSRVYLYLGKYPEAEAQASAVISNTIYKLTALSAVFTNTSTEAIWQLAPVSTSINTIEGSLFIPASTTVIPGYVLTNSLYNSFETNDARKTNWVASNTVSGQTYYYPTKYKIRTGAAPYGEYQMVFRLAEMYLIRAEARAKQNNLSGAQSDINVIRTRSGLGNTPAATQAALLTAIEQERRVELFSEWGHRWFDLKRTGRVDAVIGALKGSTFWQSTDALYPITLTDLQSNPFLVQNPGY